MTAQKIADIITAAATLHCTPVDPMSLMDSREAFRDDYLRGHLNAIVAFHIYQNHKQPIHLIAKALRAEWTTIHSRIARGKKLSKKQPWKKTYLSLP